MNATKLQRGIAAAVLVGGGAIGLVWQQRAIVGLSETSARLQERLAQRTAETARLAQVQVSTDAELNGLRKEVAALKSASAMTTNHSTAALSAATAKSGETRTGSAMPTVPDTEANRQRKARYHLRYDSFFAQRGLMPEQVERIMELFILQDDAWEDLQASVREKALRGNAPGVEDLRSKLYAPILRELEDILGADGYATYNSFQKSSYYRVAFVDRILPAFTSENAALSSVQIDQLVAVVAANDHPQHVDPTSIGSKSQIDWGAVTKQSSAFLTPAQQAAFHTYVTREKSKLSPQL